MSLHCFIETIKSLKSWRKKFSSCKNLWSSIEVDGFSDALLKKIVKVNVPNVYYVKKSIQQNHPYFDDIVKIVELKSSTANSMVLILIYIE